jgi:hypothetical protein
MDLDLRYTGRKGLNKSAMKPNTKIQMENPFPNSFAIIEMEPIKTTIRKRE